MGDQKSYRDILKEIGDKKLDGLTISELASLLREYSKYERLASQEIISEPVKSTAQPLKYTPRPQKPERRKLNELAVGKYLMTITAAVLCLLAVAIFAANFWSGLSNGLKYGLLLFAGLGLWLFGYYKLECRDTSIRPFWLGVSGLGAGVAFLDFILGHSEYDLYKIPAVGVLCLVWVGICFIMAHRQSAWLFYIIAYIGGGLVFVLSQNTIYSFQDELLCCIVVLAVLIMGFLAWRSDNKHWALAGFWVLGAWGMGSGLIDIKFLVVDYIDYGDAFQLRAGASWFHIYPYVCILLACGSTWFVSKAIPEIRKYKYASPILLSVLAFINSYFTYGMAADLFGHGYNNYAGHILAAGILISGIFVSKSGYILGISVPVIAMLAEFGDWNQILLAAALSMIASLASVKHRNKLDRLGLFLAWIVTAGIAVPEIRRIDMSDITQVCAIGISIGFLAGSLALLFYLRKYCDHKWTGGPVSCLILLCSGLYLIQGLCFDHTWLFAGLSAMSLIAFRRLYIENLDRNTQNYIITWLGTVILSGLAIGMLSFECLWFSFFDPETTWLQPFFLTMFLFLIAGFDIYGMLKSDRVYQGVLACLAANWCMWLSCHIWTPDARILISALGILISAGFVMMGFRLDKKPVRKLGLGCALFYALKLGVYDIGFNFSGGLGVSLGLLISGLGCFGISLLYNSLGRVLKNSDDRDNDTEDDLDE